MIIVEDGKTKIVFEFLESKHLLKIQKALILGIDAVGSHREHSGTAWKKLKRKIIEET